MAMVASKVIFLILFSFITYSDCLKPISLDKMLLKGVNAYSDERWSKCIEHFEESLHLYKLYKSVLNNCRTKCNDLNYESYVKEDIDDLKIYEKFFTKRNCLTKCQEQEFRNLNIDRNVADSVVNALETKKPYEYLHICYFQMHMFHKAASSAYTYLVANPNDDTMKANVKYYIDQPEVDANEVVDLESEDYTVLYALGRKSYARNNWAETVASMEEVLKDYFGSENNCRVECEQQPAQEGSSEFVISLSNNMASLLHCQQLCQNKLKSLGYNSGVEFLADILNYIQISYYHLERFEEAAQAVASYLALMPHDEDMVENEKLYSQKVDKKAFTLRSDVMHYLNRDTYEKKLLNLFHQGDADIPSNSLNLES